MDCVIALELHSHTRYSPDSLSRLEAVIAHARAIGLQRIAITDHNALAGALRAHALAPDVVIAGCEIMTTEGELLCYFLEKPLQPFLSPEETCAAVHAQGGIVGPSHPCDTRRSGLGAACVRRLAGRLDFMEVFNSRTRNPAFNDEARALALDLDLPMIVGSDAHTLAETGLSRTVLKRDYTSPQDFLLALRGAELQTQASPWRVAVGSRTAAVVHALGFGKPDPQKKRG